jgi:hypothetical protein
MEWVIGIGSFAMGGLFGVMIMAVVKAGKDE